jgi:drug/metabolite transporter (DMT)-like permease
MPSGLLYGLVAAVGWGLVDVVASVTGKRLGPIAFAAATQSVGLAVFVVLAIVTRTAIGTTAAGEALLFGAVAAVGYLAAFTALRIGPLAVVSPVMASYGGLTVVLAVVFRGEHLTAAQWIGVALTTTGIVLAALVLDDGLRKARPVSAGVAFALIACLGFAFATVGLAAPIQAAGWLPATVISRFGNVALVLTFLAVAVLAKPRALDGAVARHPDAGRGLIVGLLAVGLLDAAANTSFAVGLERSETWIVGLASSFGPALAIVFAVLALRERPRPTQWLGLAALGLGVVVLALPI